MQNLKDINLIVLFCFVTSWYQTLVRLNQEIKEDHTYHIYTCSTFVENKSMYMCDGCPPNNKRKTY